ncbi:hypothetical protein VTK56DRAFT_4959 [Thermocarpiscus australiensis]
MEPRLPTKEEIAAQATERPITQAEASALASAESDLTGRGPVKGGAAATAQSLHDRQRNLGASAEAKLPATAQLEADFAEGRPITQAEASTIASAESSITGRGPVKGGPAATAQSVHDRQQRLGATIPSGQLPAKEQVMDRAAKGRPVTQAEASVLESAESKIAGGPSRGGPAATAESLHDRQQNFSQVASEVTQKPAEEITKEDAERVQRAETRALGHPPGKGSLSAEVQSIADRDAQNAAP